MSIITWEHLGKIHRCDDSGGLLFSCPVHHRSESSKHYSLSLLDTLNLSNMWFKSHILIH